MRRRSIWPNGKLVVEGVWSGSSRPLGTLQDFQNPSEYSLPSCNKNMAAAGQKDQNKAGKNFDTGSTNALPNVDLASGIFEAPGAIVSRNFSVFFRVLC